MKKVCLVYFAEQRACILSAERQLEVLSGGERECNCNYGSTFIPCLIALLIIKRIQRSIKRLTKEYMSAYVTAGWVGWEIPATTVQRRRGFD